jgi:anti-sigma B factor antagonist
MSTSTTTTTVSTTTAPSRTVTTTSSATPAQARALAERPLAISGARRRVITLSAEGELAEQSLVQLGEELYRLAHRGNFCVVLDLTEVSHLDYRGVRPLISRAELFRQSGGDIKLCGLSPYLTAIFRAAGARDAFHYFSNAEEARVAFARSAIP